MADAAAGLLAASRQLRNGPLQWVIEQGVEMGRPSAVLVGGDAVVVGEGEMELPA